MKKILYALAIVCCFSMQSCSDWFDVKPKRLTEEEDLFSQENGFKEALTGAYMKASNSGLYGTNLTFGFLDILAQRYSPKNVNYQRAEYYTFSADNTVTANTVATIWADGYNLVANLNNLLHWTEKNKSVFHTPGYYQIVKGEALALRSYIYFDLLRLYGPVYKLNPTGRSILYRTEFNRDIADLEPADRMLGYIIDDLLEAHDLLKDVDNLNFAISNTDSDDEFLVYRYCRMNLMAVKGLLARAYLYKGDKTLAAQYAGEVIESGKFKLTSSVKITRNETVNEMIFGLNVDNSKELSNLLAENPASNYGIGDSNFFAEEFNTMSDGLNDIRVKDGSGFKEESSVYISLKYDQEEVADHMKNMIPLIRLPEMYYILAECTGDLKEATELVSEVRVMRGLEEAELYDNDAERLAALELEYRKEFFGEGQLWHFYKRHMFSTFIHCPIDEMLQANYVFNLPNDEYTFGGISSDK
ncbi:RagB/SusD family nutrient uptake outer membrane protein [Alistipes sp. OttesenSCG-928-B03]|nr:RagB/SusD family nutrient uptake outer membrane protein [Alistipes sp. OttesenSCG-928-B03]